MAICPYDSDTNKPTWWIAFYDWTSASDNITTINGAVIPSRALSDFDKTVSYIKNGADPTEKPSIQINADTNGWLTFKEAVEFAGQYDN